MPPHSPSEASMPARQAADRPPQLTLFRRWLDRELGLSFPDYEALRAWSTEDLTAFWEAAFMCLTKYDAGAFS